ncbi:M20 family metallo-hydrolase [Clostridioides mangenotii]|uniref:M20 family metallo-hydrolase n=1 Tax=Metaclostridioides mangenotii TaxID=1540 RepID=UPI002149B4DD|nr:M20 family metallo-hydrolase [Clostridioides mangenotii]MCR1954243.1 M20 family metallo-hydrolase [Clostridioides mangenotii]
MKVNISRLQNTIEKIGQFNSSPGKGCSRFSFSKEDLDLKEYLIKEFNLLGMETRVDSIGNIRSVLKGNLPKLPVIMIGSHVDTVSNGGNYDGVAGVVCALEVIRVFRENNINLDTSIELVIFSEEEGSNFNSTMVGSKSMVGKYSVEDLKKLTNNKNQSCFEVLKSIGINPENLSNDIVRKNEIKAMIELHIEQSVVLDSLSTPIGIVEAIAGMCTLKIGITGKANHAGSTPMYMRHDALVEAAKLIEKVKDIAENAKSNSSVATVGTLNAYPNSSNIIPGEVEIFIDIRDVTSEGIDEILKKINEYIGMQIEKNEFRYSSKVIAESEAIKLSSNIIKEIEHCAKKMGVNFKMMNSGAVHDSAQLAKITDVGMIFVPSINGDSHCPEEYTAIKDIELGCNLLLSLVYKLATQ